MRPAWRGLFNALWRADTIVIGTKPPQDGDGDFPARTKPEEPDALDPASRSDLAGRGGAERYGTVIA